MKIRNTTKYINHFSSAAVDVNKRRSRFHRPSKHSTTFPTGKLIPIYVDEVLPGSSRKIDVSSVVRGATPKVPVMDNAYLDITAFFVPYRLVYDDFERFMGENDSDFWANKDEYLMPKISVNLGGRYSSLFNTPLDYMGAISCNLNNADNPPKESFNALYTRGMCKVWNDWFRNQNTQSPCHIYTDGTDRNINVANIETFTTDYVIGGEYGTCLLPVNKFKDYFTSALPSPQKHDPIMIPMEGFAPVYSNLTDGDLTPIYLRDANDNAVDGALYSDSALLKVDGAQPVAGSPNTLYTRLRTDLSEAVSITVNEMRLAFQTQKFYETQARGGSRYTEILMSMFGTYSSDARLQRAEYLGGKRISIMQTQVNQTASDGDGVGTTGAYSLTSDSGYLFDKGFTEHGILYIFAYVRTDQTYSQGQERMFSRRELFDFYFPVFAHIGEQPIKNKEIYVSGNETQNEDIFGYQEAWAEYRYKPNRVSGAFRGANPNSLSFWNYANRFRALPVLNSEFCKETEENVKRTQKVFGDTQWLGDFYFDEIKEEVMPVYSVPGLIDHF